MNLKKLLSRQTISNLSRFGGGRNPLGNYRNVFTGTFIIPSLGLSPFTRAESLLKNPKYPIPDRLFYRFMHTGQETVVDESASGVEAESDESEEDDEVMNEFLSRFVWIMRGMLTEVYTDSDKKEIDGMLLVIVEKVVSEMEKGNLEMGGSAATTPSQDLSEDLWRTVWEVSNVVLEDMRKAKKKEKMKYFLQSEEVKEMARFAAEAGVRGDMLRELRFKWAREKLEESEFYESLERIREEIKAQDAEMSEVGSQNQLAVVGESVEGEEKAQVISLPKRSGKIKYKIYGLDLSGSKWAKVADNIHEAGEVLRPQEPKPILGKCEIVTEKILSLQVDDDPSPLLAEWIELLEPGRIDWIALLDRLKVQNNQLYCKVAELLLDEVSFETNIRDYYQLIDVHFKHNRLDDAERILKKMNEKGVEPDILIKTTMVHMYSKAGNLERTKEAFENLRSQGFQPDHKVFKSMIMAYVNASQPEPAEELLRKLESRNPKPSEDIYLALLQSYAQNGDVKGAVRVKDLMDFAGFPRSSDVSSMLVEAYCRKGDPDLAREHFDDIIKLGCRPNDNCIARMTAAYAEKNLLDKGLNLLLQLEKDGVEPGIATYSVLVDWLGRLQLIDEAEDLLGKMTEQGDSLPLDVHISLCDMYSRARVEKKALQALGVLEAKKDQLKHQDFERIINALVTGGFVQDADRWHGLMKDRGFSVSYKLNVSLLSSQSFNPKRAR